MDTRKLSPESVSPGQAEEAHRRSLQLPHGRCSSHSPASQLISTPESKGVG